MKTNFLHTDNRLFLVKFAWTTKTVKFITPAEGIAEIFKQHYEGRGIEYIKEFDYISNTFKRISKDELYRAFSYHTEAVEELKKAKFFDPKKY